LHELHELKPSKFVKFVKFVAEFFGCGLAAIRNTTQELVEGEIFAVLNRSKDSSEDLGTTFPHKMLPHSPEKSGCVNFHFRYNQWALPNGEALLRST